MKAHVGVMPHPSAGGRSRKLLLALSLAASALIGAACGPAYLSTGFEVGPPSPSYQDVYYEGRDGYVWVEGRYDWDGSAWIWRPGSWILARPGLVYIQGYWEQSSGHWTWISPYWAEQRDGYVHVRGYWTINGENRVWTTGRWESQRPGHTWVHGSWHSDPSSQQWQRGHWSQSRTAPAHRSTPERRRR